MNEDYILHNDTFEYMVQSNIVKQGNIDFVKKYIMMRTLPNDNRIYEACEAGHLDIADFLMNEKRKYEKARNYLGSGHKNDLDKCLSGACKGGHKDIVKLMISEGATNLYGAFHTACCGGHMDVVELLRGYGIKFWNYGLRSACQGGNMNIINLVISMGDHDWNDGLTGACQGGHLDIAKLMIEKGNDVHGNNVYEYDYCFAFYYACMGGNIDVVKFISEKYIGKSGLNEAYINGHTDVVEFILSKKIPEVYIDVTRDFPIHNKKTKYYRGNIYKNNEKFIHTTILYWVMVYNYICSHGHSVLQNDLIPDLLKLIYF